MWKVSLCTLRKDKGQHAVRAVGTHVCLYRICAHGRVLFQVTLIVRIILEIARLAC